MKKLLIVALFMPCFVYSQMWNSTNVYYENPYYIFGDFKEIHDLPIEHSSEFIMYDTNTICSSISFSESKFLIKYYPCLNPNNQINPKLFTEKNYELNNSKITDSIIRIDTGSWEFIKDEHVFRKFIFGFEDFTKGNYLLIKMSFRGDSDVYGIFCNDNYYNKTFFLEKNINYFNKLSNKTSIVFTRNRTY